MAAILLVHRASMAAVMALLLLLISCAPETLAPPPRPEVVETPIEEIDPEENGEVDPAADVEIIEAEPDDEDAVTDEVDNDLDDRWADDEDEEDQPPGQDYR